MDLTSIAKAIKLMIDTQVVVERPRDYLGMSQLGHSCPRYLWMYFRWANKVKYKHRSQRIFRRGDLEEDRVIGYWESIGINIISRQRELVACDGHLRGHTDGLVDNLPDLGAIIAVGEIKTMANKYFVPLSKKGLKAAKPEYYTQAQVYMHYEGVGHCLHSTTNKDNEELHIELLKYDGSYVEPYIDRAEDVIKTVIPPKKISNDPTYFQCTWCDFYGPCQLEDKFLKTCRTCQYAMPVADGKWYCNEHKKELTTEEQEAACDKYDSLKV